jgi:hypothetical protein
MISALVVIALIGTGYWLGKNKKVDVIIYEPTKKKLKSLLNKDK